MIIRNEKEDDHKIVEELTKRAFWNLHVPGCNEHYLVHKMRSHSDFIPELDFVIEVDNKIIGNIMYTKSKLLNNQNQEVIILTFGPVSIEPQYQRKGYGKKLIEHSFEKAKGMGYNYIVIYGNPCNYLGLGFKSCKRFSIYVGDEIYPSALLVRQIGDNSLSNEKWKFVESDVYAVDNNEAELFDKGFETMQKEVTHHQEEFYILSNSRVTA